MMWSIYARVSSFRAKCAGCSLGSAVLGSVDRVSLDLRRLGIAGSGRIQRSSKIHTLKTRVRDEAQAVLPVRCWVGRSYLARASIHQLPAPGGRAHCLQSHPAPRHQTARQGRITARWPESARLASRTKRAGQSALSAPSDCAPFCHSHRSAAFASSLVTRWIRTNSSILGSTAPLSIAR